MLFRSDATLAGDAYLKTSGASERFRTDSDKNWPLARLGFAKIGGGGAAFDLIGEKATRALITGANFHFCPSNQFPQIVPKICLELGRYPHSNVLQFLGFVAVANWLVV